MAIDSSACGNSGGLRNDICTTSSLNVPQLTEGLKLLQTKTQTETTSFLTLRPQVTENYCLSLVMWATSHNQAHSQFCSLNHSTAWVIEIVSLLLFFFHSCIIQIRMKWPDMTWSSREDMKKLCRSVKRGDADKEIHSLDKKKDKASKVG